MRDSMKRYQFLTWMIIAATFSFSGIAACQGDKIENSQSPDENRPIDTEQSNQNSTSTNFHTFVGTLSAQKVLNVDSEGRAIHGYDPVAYFEQGQAMEGNPTIGATWQGVQWLFTTEAHRDAFLANPDQYAPQNGGFCTFGVVVEQKLDVDPMVWLIEGDKLYLFLSPQTRSNFLTDKVNNLKKVDMNWPKVKNLTSPQS
jgi:YHS domain-containing protein